MYVRIYYSRAYIYIYIVFIRASWGRKHLDTRRSSGACCRQFTGIILALLGFGLLINIIGQSFTMDVVLKPLLENVVGLSTRDV